MASAMRKMAVYLGLVEDDHRYQDKYDSYGEYEDYEEQAARPEQIDEPDVRGAREDYVGYQPAVRPCRGHRSAAAGPPSARHERTEPRWRICSSATAR